MRITQRSWWVWLGFVLVLTLPLHAGEVIDFMPPEADRAEITSRLEKLLQEEVILVPMPADLVARSRMATPDPATSCPPGPGSDDNTLRLISLAWQQLLGLDTGAALRSLELARARLPCEHVILERDRIRELFLYEAVALIYQGQVTRATAVMLDVAGLGLDWGPGSRFNPRVQQVWNDARAQASQRTPTRLSFEGGLGRLWIDGSPAEDEIFLLPGRHVVQVVPTGGESIRSDLVEVPASTEPVPLESLTTFGLEPLEEYTTNWQRALTSQRLDPIHTQVTLQWLEEHAMTELRWVIPGENGALWYGSWSEAKGFGGERLPEKVSTSPKSRPTRPERPLADGMRVSAGPGLAHLGLLSVQDQVLANNAMTLSVAVEQLVGTLAFGVWVDTFAGVVSENNSGDCLTSGGESCSCVSMSTGEGDIVVCGVTPGHPVSTAVGGSARISLMAGRLVLEPGVDMAATWVPLVLSVTPEGDILRSSRVYLGPTAHVTAGTELAPGWWVGLVTRGGIQFARSSLGLQHLSPVTATLRLGHTF